MLKGAGVEVAELAFSPDGQAIAAGFDSFHGVYLWNLEAATTAPVRLSTEGEYAKAGLQFSPNGRSLSWRKIDGRRSYNRDTREYQNHSFAITGVTHEANTSADGSRVISKHAMPDYCLIGWRPVDGEWVRTWTVPTIDMQTESLALSADGRLFAMITRPAIGTGWTENSRRVEVRDGATGAVLGTGEYLHSYAGPLLFSPDNCQLLGFNGMSLIVWPVPPLGVGSLPRIVQNDNRKHFTALAYHPSGRYLFATSNDTTVHVFDTTTWERVKRFTWQLGKLKAVTVSADGTLAAAGGDNGDIVIWIWDVDL
jgi:WD40 repeat protein